MADLNQALARYANMSWASMFRADPPLVVVTADASGAHTVRRWNVPGVPEPTPAQITGFLNSADPDPSKSELSSYALAAQTRALSEGKTFNVAANGTADVLVLCDGSPGTRSDLRDMASRGAGSASGTWTWVDNNNVATVLSGAQLVTLDDAVSKWREAMFEALGALLQGIGSGKVKTHADVDAVSWPGA